MMAKKTVYKEFDIPNSGSGRVDLDNADLTDSTFIETDGYVSVGATVSASGSIRLPDDGSIFARNSTDDGNLRIVAMDGSDNVVLGQSSGINKATVAAGTIEFQDDATVVGEINTTGLGLFPAGATAAATGAIRLPNNTAINTRRAGAAVDLNLISSDASDDIFVGDSNSNVELFIDCGTDVNFRRGGTEKLTIGLNSIHWADGGNDLNATMQTATSGAGKTYFFIGSGGAAGQNGGNIEFRAGRGGNTTGDGGNLTFSCGQPAANGDSGTVNFKLYDTTETQFDAFVYTFDPSTTPDQVVVTGGNATQGFDAHIKSADGSSSAGLNLFISGGDGDTNQNGADVTISSGAGNGSGDDGYVIINSGTTEVARFDNFGSPRLAFPSAADIVTTSGGLTISIAGSDVAEFNEGYLGLKDVTSAPATPTGGGRIFVEAGALKYIGSDGHITTLADA
jgi:hypothetical protein